MRGVLTLAGEGTRVLPWTRGLRKEFLPLYDRGTNGHPVLKPVAHLALETLVDAGISEITLVVGGKDLDFVRNYFRIDTEFLERHADQAERLQETKRFYRTLRRLRIQFAVQPAPRGFGDAVLRARRCVGSEPFVLHAADAHLFEPERGTLPARMARMLQQEELDGVLLVRPVPNPTSYGVVEGTPDGRFEGTRKLRVLGMEEKPARPKTRWAATAIYAFGPTFFDALRTVQDRDHPKELEVTDAIRELLAQGGRIAALILAQRDGEWRSVGSPDRFAVALRRSGTWASKKP
jgi:UTP--glucose-1-phosphate uridylyltransferase